MTKVSTNPTDGKYSSAEFLKAMSRISLMASGVAVTAEPSQKHAFRLLLGQVCGCFQCPLDFLAHEKSERRETAKRLCRRREKFPLTPAG